MLYLEVEGMEKLTIAIKMSQGVMKDFKQFCKSHGIKYSFFVEEAVREKLEEEELKEDLLDLKRLRAEEKSSVAFEDYLKERNV